MRDLEAGLPVYGGSNPPPATKSGAIDLTQYMFGKSEEYAAKIGKSLHQKILSLVVTHMKPERPIIEFDPLTDLQEEWDQRLVVPVEGLEGIGKVRAHLTDHGSVEALREHSGMMVDTQYSVALMMESEA